jgi:hypothetical protein
MQNDPRVMSENSVCIFLDVRPSDLKDLPGFPVPVLHMTGARPFYWATEIEAYAACRARQAHVAAVPSRLSPRLTPDPKRPSRL